MFSEVISKSLLVIVSALIGAGSIFLIKLNHHRLCGLISFSAGALLGAALFSILPETYHSLNILELIISVGSGYLIFLLISKYYFHVCPACSASHFDEQTTKKFSEIVLLMITALAFHSFFDGLALTGGGEHAHFDSNSIFLAIAVHKFPEGLALASLMAGAGYTKLKLLTYVVLVESATLLGGIAGIFLIDFHISEFWFAILMAHIAGGFIFLAFHAIIGEMLKNHTRLVLVTFTLGALVILLARVLATI